MKPENSVKHTTRNSENCSSRIHERTNTKDHSSMEARIRSLTQLGQLPNTGPKVPISKLAMSGGLGSLCHMNLDPMIYPSAV